ncbi:MAG: multidrug efflux RND transporter permease subunit [Burkholderiaceae bacterium]|nr:multidrug efflux RND transporter permease subunit [Burkholderiaceae bacterium]
MISEFFIRRPIFAIVTSLVIVIGGLLSMLQLPVEQYPNMSPVQITVSATYPGADAQTVAETVASPIETQINGVDNMIYMTSSSSSSGTMSITVFFGIGTDPDIAQVQVQNRVNLAQPQLPEEVITNGLTVEKRSSSILMLIGIYGTDDRYSREYISNYANVYVLDAIKRVPGAGQSAVMGSANQAMRIWLNPDRMASLGITTSDVQNAVSVQNQRFASGNLGASPSVPNTIQTFPIVTPSPAVTAQGYENIILRASQDESAIVRLKDVADVSLGRQSYDVNSNMNGRPTTFIAVYLQAGANALDVASDVKETLNTLKTSFPDGLDYRIAVDTTTYVKISIQEVLKTLLEAALLVIAVIFLFLQNFKSTAIACSAIIVSLTGTFIGMYALGFSINQLTLFGLVLAIGLVVDDAIVVVENVERNIAEHNMNSVDATISAMREVTGPVIATVLVLGSVFIPAGFISGTIGMLYKQFAITIAISVTISGFVALTLTPALCATWLEHREPPVKGFFYWFNNWFTRLTQHYVSCIRNLFSRTFLLVVSLVDIVFVIVQLFRVTPTGFVPEEDQGYLMAALIMPSGASLERTSETMDILEKNIQAVNGIETANSIAGFSLLDGGIKSSGGTFFMTLTPFDERYKNSKTSQLLSASTIKGEIGRIGFTHQLNGIFVPITPPAIPGLGTTGGFEFWIQDTNGSNPEALQTVVDQFIAEAKRRPELTGLTTTFNANNQQLKIHYDRDKAQLLGITSQDVFGTLQAQFGSSIVSQFSQFSHIWYVIMQAHPQYRIQPSDIGRLYVRNTSGDMIPLSSVVTAEYVRGPTQLPHYNGFPAAQIIGNASAGYSSGDGMKALEEVASKVLPKGYSYGWSGISYEQQSSGASSAVAFAFGLLLVFLVLAAQYESWTLPGSVLLAVPFGLIGALIATWSRGLINDVYFQIGLLVMIGLAAKNAILIVEFAVELRNRGLELLDAAVNAGEIRFRPIIMTSLAFIGGTLPLMFATGAGAASRHSLGTGIVGGMIGVSTLALLFVPIFYVWFERWAEKRAGKKAVQDAIQLAKRNIPLTEKIRKAILCSSGKAYDVNAKIEVTAKGQITITNSPSEDSDSSALASSQEKNLGERQ